jgi:2-hydroxy-3-keto-5-methylthiopentenyl-1-phosphate phosphatase
MTAPGPHARGDGPPCVGAVLVDFDGTACSHDVAEHLLEAFGEPGWLAYDEAVDRGEIGLRTALVAQDAMLGADRDTLMAFALEHCPLDPSFPAFCRWLAAEGVEVAVVSDGFGFYIEPILAANGLGDLTVIANRQRWDEALRPEGLAFDHGHPMCVGCGTCKMRAVLDHRRSHGTVAFVGEGQSDRYGALYADLVFAKDALVAHCREDGVPFTPWTDFDDVRRVLASGAPPPGPLAPVACPGWTPPGDRSPSPTA